MAPHGHGPDDGNAGPAHHGDTPGHVITTDGHEHERSVPPPLVPGDPGPKEVAEAGPCECAMYRARGGRWQHLPAAENPSPRGSFGYVGSFARVPADSKKGTASGTLVFPVQAERLGGVARGSLRVFRWIAQEHGWELVARSALGQVRDYVWAEVEEPGLYAPIGVHSDPLIARTLGWLAATRRGRGIPDEGFGAELSEKVCGLFLCDAELRRRLDDPALYRALVEDNLRQRLPGTWLPHRKGEKPFRPPLPELDLCAVCRELAAGRARLGPGSHVAQPPETAMLAMSLSPQALEGEWQLVTPVPSLDENVLAVHAALLPTGKIFYFAGSENVGARNVQGGAAIDNSRLFDPDTGTITVVGSPPRYDVFCCGHTLMADGRLLAAGGTRSWGGVTHPNHGVNFEGLRLAAVFDAFAPIGSNPWTPVARLCPERGQTRGGGSWYPTLVTLPDGKVLKMGGPPEFEDSRHNNRTLEIFDPATGHWTDQGAGADIPASDTADLPQYPRLHVLPNGRVFCATPIEGPQGGPGWVSWIWNPAMKTWSNVGSGPGGGYVGFDTTSVLLPLRHAAGYRARVLYCNRPDPKIIDLSMPAPTWQNTSPRALSYPVTGPPMRYHATAVILADATVILIGGHNDPNNWDPSELTPEKFDPETGVWSTLATAAVPRVYHSVALLLPDGRVWTGGSDYGNGVHETRMEIYSPPYLFAGARPVLSSAPDVLTAAESFHIQTPDATDIQTVALVRCATSTHAFSIDQRWVDLAITAVQQGRLTVTAPPNTRLAPPGFYMLFLLNASGVPSVAKIVRFQAGNEPTISSLHPRSGPSTGGTVVKISGTNFRPGATVTFGGVAATGVAVAGEMEMTATAPALLPGALHDVVVTNPDASTAAQQRGWFADFLDVPSTHMFHDAVERLFRSGVTAGCGGGNFCPGDPVTRAQMAAFLLRAEHGPGWAPPPATGAVFADIPANAFAAGAIEQAAAEGIFPGGAGAFGPNVNVDRASMAELLLKAEHGPGYVPPPATGIFMDVPAASPQAPWIERLFKEGITSGCGPSNYCPNDTSTRGQMAVFLMKTFGLP